MKNHKIGDVIEGEVTSTTSFGAFVKIGSVEGLCIMKMHLGTE